MLPRPASHGSRLCIGILLVFVSTTLVKSQISASLDLSRPSTISGNSTVLNRIIQEEDSILPLTSSNGEGKLAFQSPIIRSTEASEWPENSSDITDSELYSTNKNRNLLNNRDLLETTSAYHSQATTATSSPIIDLEESPGSNGVTKKHLIEELIGESYSIIKENENIKIPEFNEHIDYSDIEDNDKLGNREPTTTKIPRDNDGMISLINDTNVNYKTVKSKEHVEDDAMMTMNLKITQENVTNVISGESDINVKSKIPKSTQMEIIKNVTTGPKPMRITEFDEFDNKLYKNISSKATTPMSSSIIPDILNKNDDSIIKNNENNDNNHEKNERNSLPKGRTISFSGINQFSNTEVKAVGSIQDTSSEVEFTKEIKPYPYLKSSTINSLNSSKQLVDSSIDELSALENTIGKSPDIKKLVITESSAVIDNSIQQIKPNNFKRSGNLSRMSNFNATSLLSSVTLRPRELIEGTNSSTTQSIISDKTVNIIPINHDGVIEKKSNLDLSSNGLTENVENNKTIINESRATETNLVQNSTETVEISDEAIETATNRDIQTNAEDSMLLVSSLNVTEDSTKIPIIKSNSNESISSTTTFIVPLTSTIIPDKIFNDDTITTTTITTADITQTPSNPVTMSSITSQSLPPSPTIENDSTTSSGVEYVFIGLTESTVSPNYISNSDTTSKTLTTDVTELTSNLSDISTTISSTDSSTASSMIQDLSSEINNDNLTILTTINPDDLMTTYSSMPDDFVSTTDNPLDTTVYTTSEYTDMPYPDETTIIQEETTYPEFKMSNESESNTSSSIDSINPTIPLITTTTTMRTEMTTSNITNVTASSGPSNTAKITPSIEIIPVTLSTGNSTSSMNTESPAVNIVTNIQPFTPEDVNLLVRIVVENTWNDICANLSDLRQSLADLLTAGIKKTVLAIQIIFQKNPCMEKLQENIASSELTLSTLYLYVVNQNGNFDATMTRILPSLYSSTSIKSQLTIRSIQLVQDSDSGNAIAVVVVSCVALICLVLLAGLLFIMRKRQTRFNYGERCRPVSLDAFSLDSVSAYNSVRRKGANRASKRSYGNPTFEDSTAIPSHPLNFTGLSTFCNEQNTIYEEFTGIPQVSAKIDELPSGAEVKNRYANVIPLPETRVQLLKINDDPLSDYINASYVRGPKNATKYYIACQSPIESTVTDFWRMIWEQQSKVIIMLTDLVENGTEKCAEYIPPSEVTDCHRLYGDYQVTLKKRETKEKYAISTLHLKNLENNTYREISHIWYLWPVNGVQTDAAGLIAVLLEARALQRGGPTPIVVHCSPGTGRTGTLIALDLAIRQYEITRTVDVPRVVYTIRRDRAGAVQTKEQYAFIYKALNLYATKLAGGGLEST